jgi:hypothetical protein
MTHCTSVKNSLLVRLGVRKTGALRDASMYMSTEHDIDVSLYKRNVAYIDA